MNKLPDYFWADRLTPINYYRYRSSVQDRFFEVRVLSEEEKVLHQEVIRRFNDLKKKCMTMSVNINDLDQPDWTTDLWDNKIVIECRTELGETIFVGFSDFTYSIGKSVSTDSWIKPWPYRELTFS